VRLIRRHPENVMQVLAVDRTKALDEGISDVLASLLPRLYNFARYRLEQADAEDAVGAAVEHLWRTRHRFPADGDYSLEWWAWRVAVNKVLDEVRRKRRQQRAVSLSDLDLIHPESADLAERVAQLLRLRAALNKLNPRDADLIALRFGADMTNPEIAELLGSNPGAIAVALHRALARLREQMTQGD
jgi:RNA polymerase sigma-70 factor (ECF subfamily)